MVGFAHKSLRVNPTTIQIMSKKLDGGEKE
jgi:hypothetical protein